MGSSIEPGHNAIFPIPLLPLGPGSLLLFPLDLPSTGQKKVRSSVLFRANSYSAAAGPIGCPGARVCHRGPTILSKAFVLQRNEPWCCSQAGSPGSDLRSTAIWTNYFASLVSCPLLCREGAEHLSSLLMLQFCNQHFQCQKSRLCAKSDVANHPRPQNWKAMVSWIQAAHPLPHTSTSDSEAIYDQKICSSKRICGFTLLKPAIIFLTTQQNSATLVSRKTPT